MILYGVGDSPQEFGEQIVKPIVERADENG